MLFLVIDLFSVLPLLKLIVALQVDSTMLMVVFYMKKGQLLETTLKNFGVDARVTQIKIGPAVTQYEIQPAQGVKVSKIVNLHNDIALALAAKDVRIEAPIPGSRYRGFNTYILCC